MFPKDKKHRRENKRAQFEVFDQSRSCNPSNDTDILNPPFPVSVFRVRVSPVPRPAAGASAPPALRLPGAVPEPPLLTTGAGAGAGRTIPVRVAARATARRGRRVTGSRQQG